jgi:ribosomal protein S18 acetylase RimI-like enzyme
MRVTEMDVRLEPFAPERHDAETVAGLIFDADPELMALGFGERDQAVRILSRLMRLDDNQYAAENITCAQLDGVTVGILVGFTGRKKQHYHKASGQDYIRSYGFWRMLTLLLRSGMLQKIVTQAVAEDEYCVFGLAVAPAFRNQGIGALLLNSALQQHHRVCLDVNIANEAAQRFYRRHGFRQDGESTVAYRGRRIGNYCMRRP